MRENPSNCWKNWRLENSTIEVKNPDESFNKLPLFSIYISKILDLRHFKHSNGLISAKITFRVSLGRNIATKNGQISCFLDLKYFFLIKYAKRPRKTFFPSLAKNVTNISECVLSPLQNSCVRLTRARNLVNDIFLVNC